MHPRLNSSRLLGFELLNDRADGRSLRTIRRETQVVFVSGDRFFGITTLFVCRSEQLINDRFGIRELIDGDLKFSGRQIVLPFLLVSAAQSDMRFRLKAVAFANRTLETANRALNLSCLAIDAAFDRGSFGIDSAVASRCLDFGKRTVRICHVEQHTRKSHMRRRISCAISQSLSIKIRSLLSI